MRILLLNDNKIVSRLISLTCEKNGIDFKEIEKVNDVGENENYDYIFIDGDFYTDELKEEITSKIDYRYLGYIASKGTDIPDGIDIVLEKPFLPTDFLELIQNHTVDDSTQESEIKQEEEENALEDKLEKLDDEFDFNFDDIEEDKTKEEEEKEEEKKNKNESETEPEEIPQEGIGETGETEEKEQKEDEEKQDDDILKDEDNYFVEENKPEEEEESKKDEIEDDILLDRISQEIADEFKEKSETDEKTVPDFEVEELYDTGEKEDEIKKSETILDKDDIETVKHFLDEEESSEDISKTDSNMQTNDFSSLTQEALLNALQEVHIKESEIAGSKEEIIKQEEQEQEEQNEQIKEETKEDMPPVEYDTFEVTEKNKNELEEEIQNSISETLEKVEMMKKVLEDMEINITINFKSKK